MFVAVTIVTIMSVAIAAIVSVVVSAVVSAVVPVAGMMAAGSAATVSVIDHAAVR